MSQALVIGSVALDSVSTPHGKVDDALGGSASFGSTAASYFAPTKLVAVVGEDFPTEHVDKFKTRGINVDGLKYEEGQTFRWSGYYEMAMDQAHTNTTFLNVFEKFRPDLSDEDKKSKYVFLANIDPSLQLHVLNQLEAPEVVALDTMNFWIEGSKKELTRVLEKCTVLLMNEEEAKQYCETGNLIKAGEELLKLGPKTVALKKGEHGALLFQEEGIFAVPAYPLRSLKDPTGAGDTFAGSLVGYLANLNDPSPANIRKAVLVGTVMASFAVEDFSLNRTLSLNEEEIVGRVQELERMIDIPNIDPAMFI